MRQIAKRVCMKLGKPTDGMDIIVDNSKMDQ